MAKTAALPSPNTAAGSKTRRKTVLPLLAVLLLLAIAGGVAWQFGVFASLIEDVSTSQEASPPPPRPPVLVDVPPITVGLPVPAGRRAVFARVVAKLEVAGPEDVAIVQALMPRVIDIMQTRVREMHREEFHTQAAIARLRAEILASVAIATSPAQVRNVIFEQLIVQ